MLRNVHNAADHPEIDASLQLAKRCVPFGMYAKCVEACWSRTFPSPQFTPFVSISKQMRDWHCSMCRVPCVAHCRAHQLDIASVFLLSGTCTQEYENMGEEAFCAKVSGAASPMPFDDVKSTRTLLLTAAPCMTKTWAPSMMSARERVRGGGQGGGLKQGGSTASAHQGTWDGMDRVRESHKRADGHT